MAKKETAKTPVKTVQTVKDLRNLTETELQTTLQTAREDLLAAQKMLRANELPSAHVIRRYRRAIARIHTVLTEKANSGKEKNNG
jgi:ribosomal protein L29